MAKFTKKINGLPLGGSAEVEDAIVNGVTTKAPSQNAVFDALATKQNSLGYTAENQANKTNTVTGNEASTSLYLSVKGYYDYLIGLTWLTATSFGTWITGLTAKATPVDTDTLIVNDGNAKKTTWLQVKNTLKTYFDTFYVGINGIFPNSIKIGNTTDTPAVAGGGAVRFDGKAFLISDGVGNANTYWNTLTARKYTAHSFTTSTVITTTAITLNNFAVGAVGVNYFTLSSLSTGSVIKFKYLGVLSANIGNGTRTINIKLGTVQVLTLVCTGGDSNFSAGNILRIEGEVILDTASSCKGNLIVNFGSGKANYITATTTSTNIAAFTSGALNIELVNNNAETSTMLGSTLNIEIIK